jgi:DNA-binding protein HU-beta
MMNKSDLIAVVAEAVGVSITEAANAIDTTFDVISNALINGDNVRLTGFGSFGVAQRAARQARKPRSREPVEIAASRRPKFKPGKRLKDAVSG